MGIQNTPVDSMATVSIPQATNQATSACKSGVNVANTRTGSASRSGGTAATISALPISRPAALGKTQANSSSSRFLGVFLLGIQAPPVAQRVKVSASPVMQISSLLIGVVRTRVRMPPVTTSSMTGNQVAARAQSLQRVFGS